jgi:2'-5' RNA ligase
MLSGNKPSVGVFIALEPPPALFSSITLAKELVNDCVGEQKYLKDPPHLTLQVGNFYSLPAVISALSISLQNVRRPMVNIDGWHVFYDDPLTGGHTVVTATDESSKSQLRHIQSIILASLVPLRDTEASTDRYKPGWKSLSIIRQQSVLRFGFPFTGQDWHPHVSVASVEKSLWGKVYNQLVGVAPRGEFEFQSVILYRLDDDQAPVPVREFPLLPR